MGNGDLKEALVGMGAKDIFDKARADLSGIIEKPPKPDERLLTLDHFIQKVKIDILDIDKYEGAPLYHQGRKFTYDTY